MYGPDLGNAMARMILVMCLISAAVGAALILGGWALWHYVLSHIHWSWS